MIRKGIPLNKQIYEELKKCKIKETERNTKVIERLLDKYEERLLNGE